MGEWCVKSLEKLSTLFMDGPFVCSNSFGYSSLKNGLHSVQLPTTYAKKICKIKNF